MLLKPLNSLTSTKNAFNWDDGIHLKAFLQSRVACSDYLTNALVDWDEPFILCTDTCDTGIGAGLFQGPNGSRLVRIYSQAFTTTQQRWSTLDQEAYAIVRSLAEFRPYLLGIEFIVEMDHRPLLYLIRAAQANKGSAKNHCWFCSIQMFRCVYRHIAGAKNIVADVLS